MAASLTEREMFIAMLVFTNTLQTVIDMEETCEAAVFCKLQLNDPLRKLHLVDRIHAQLEMLEAAGIAIPGEVHNVG